MKTQLFTVICAMAALPAFGAKTWEIDAGWARPEDDMWPTGGAGGANLSAL